MRIAYFDIVSARTLERGEDAAHGRAAALALIEEHRLAELTDEAQQLVSSSSPTPHPHVQLSSRLPCCADQ